MDRDRATILLPGEPHDEAVPHVAASIRRSAGSSRSWPGRAARWSAPRARPWPESGDSVGPETSSMSRARPVVSAGRGFRVALAPETSGPWLRRSWDGRAVPRRLGLAPEDQVLVGALWDEVDGPEGDHDSGSVSVSEPALHQHGKLAGVAGR